MTSIPSSRDGNTEPPTCRHPDQLASVGSMAKLASAYLGTPALRVQYLAAPEPHSPFDGNMSLVLRFRSRGASVVAKANADRQAYSRESLNLGFLNAIIPSQVPTVLRKDEDVAVLLLEDVGDVSPAPSDAENDSEQTTAVWGEIVCSLADVHSAASDAAAERARVYGRELPRRRFRQGADLSGALCEGWRRVYSCPPATGARLAITSALDETRRLMDAYRAAGDPYAIGERSAPNIRLLNKRVVHIDHCSLPGQLPSADLVSLWRSPRRKELVERYIKRRMEQHVNFDSGAFRDCDHAFTLYNSIVWCCLRLRTMVDSKARLPDIDLDPTPRIMENLSLAAEAAEDLRMDQASEVLFGLFGSLERGVSARVELRRPREE